MDSILCSVNIHSKFYHFLLFLAWLNAAVVRSLKGVNSRISIKWLWTFLFHSDTRPGNTLIDFSHNWGHLCGISATSSSAELFGVWIQKGPSITYQPYQMLSLILQLWIKHLLQLINTWTGDKYFGSNCYCLWKAKPLRTKW